MGINTVDSFDIHGSILDYRTKQMENNKRTNTVSVIAAGWDPGSDSVVRILLESLAPEGLSYTNFGPGRSMGHSVVARSKKGVKEALSMTIPLGEGIHRRMVYVELEEGANLEDVTKELKADDYFAHDELHVFAVPSVAALNDVGHGVHMTRKGVSGKTHNQHFSFDMSINNPALTAQVLVNVHVQVCALLRVAIQCLRFQSLICSQVTARILLQLWFKAISLISLISPIWLISPITSPP